MVYWETADQNPSASEIELEFARIWQALPKIVFSTTLTAVEGNARLATDGVAEEVAKLKQEPGKDLAVGGAGLAATFTQLGLIDEYRLFVSPVVLGGGTPYFPPLDERIALELVETRTFGSRVKRSRQERWADRELLHAVPHQCSHVLDEVAHLKDTGQRRAEADERHARFRSGSLS